MHDSETIIRAQMQDFSVSMGNEIELFIVRRLDGKVVEHAQPIVMVERVEHAQVPVLACIDKRQGQQLMDDLWQCGLRPSEGTG